VETIAQPLSLADVKAAAERLHGVARRTPLLTSTSLDVRLGASVHLKCENFQRAGAFKFRGAYNRIVQLSLDERRRGVVAFSSGNHAQGVALAAKMLDAPAVIIMPTDAPPMKLAATKGYGAEVILYDRATGDRAAMAAELARERGLTVVPPFDDPAIIAGQGTATLELLEDEPEIDLLAVPLGGGGLLAGACLAASEREREIEIYGVEPEAGDDWVQSLARGERVSIPVPQTIADGAQTTSPGAINFPIVRTMARGVVTVSDRELREAIAFAFERLKIVIEPTGALALAALMSGKIDVAGRRAGAIISGGNIGAAAFAAALEAART
jgi:threonine dehydratase